MAGPQLEDGHTRVANEILDEICRFKFNGAQLRIIIKIWRLTYGYSRKDHEFALVFLISTTGLSERTIKKEVKALIKANVLLVTRRPTRSASRRMAFNKHYEEWSIPKSGDLLDEQLDLFTEDEVHDTAPNNGEDWVHDTAPNEVHYTAPNSRNGVQYSTPIKRNKDLKKSIKEKEAMFAEFYSIYPRKISRKKAEASWRTLCKDKDFDPDIAIAYTANYTETCRILKTEVKYMPYPSTFLNQKRYEDYPAVDPEGLAANSQSKFDSNIEFLRGQIGGDGSDPGSSRLAIGEGGGILPEQDA